MTVDESSIVEWWSKQQKNQSKLSLTRIHRPDGDNADGQEGGHDEDGGENHAENDVKIFIVGVCKRDGLNRVTLGSLEALLAGDEKMLVIR